MKITIPEDLSEITVKQYQKFSKIVEENPDSEDFLAMKMVEIFCNISFKDVQQIPVGELEEIVKILNNTFESKRKFKQRLAFKDIGESIVEYGFIPDLENMSFGEYVDLNSYLESVQDLNKLMAVLYRPIVLKSKELYTIEKYEPNETREWLMYDFPLDVALESQSFFFLLAKELLMNTEGFLATQLKEMEEQTQKQTSGQSGGGIKAFTHSLKAMFSNLTVSQN